jgi:hypothetical protein
MNKSLALIIFTAALAFAQVDTGAISGLVRDESGAAITSADVTVTNTATNIEQRLATNASGFYSSPSLKPGLYTIRAKKDGFAIARREKIELRVQDRLEVNFDLKISATNTEITVSTEAPRLESESSSLGNVVANRTIIDLPLNGRNFSQLATLGAGTLPARKSAERDSFVANGARPVQNSYLLDGVENKNRIVGFDNGTAQSIQPILDAIQEFKVQTSTYSAEFGQSAGGVVNVSMRGGTNDLHGSLFAFHRNSAVSATPYFQPVRGQKPQFLQNQFGTTLGGPLKKNRTFYFASWQSSRELSAAPQISTVPTAELRQGDFGTRAIFDPDTTRANPAGSGFIRDPFPGNRLPATRWDAVAAKAAPLYPAPNLPGAVRNYFYNPKQTVFSDQGNLRFDHQLSQKDALFARVSIHDGRNSLPTLLPPPASTPVLATPTAQSVAASHTRIVTPTAVNEIRFGYMRTRLQQSTPAERLFESFGIKGVFNDETVKGLPTFGITGLSTLGTTGPGTLLIGSTGSGNLPIDKWGRVLQLTDTFSLVKGKHTLKIGGDLQEARLFGFVTLQARPAINFTGVYSQSPQNRASTGSPYADFLIGYAATTTISNRPRNESRQRIAQGFVQDDWKVTPKLTVNLGLRYELALPWVEVDGRQSGLILEQGPLYGKLLQIQDLAGTGYNASFMNTDRNNFAPRIGVAYKAASKTVVRSAFGVFYGRDENLGISRRITNNPPFFVRTQIVGDQIVPNFILAKGYPAGILEPGRMVNPEVNSVPKDSPLPYILQWNFNLQQELPSKFVLQLGYTGSGGRKLYYTNNINQPFPGAGAVDARRPIQGFSGIFQWAPLFKSSYNAFTTQLDRRFSNGFSLLASYTYGHSIDDGPANSESGDPAPQDARNLRANRGNSSFDIRHRFVTSYTWELPFGHSRLGRGWQVAGITSWQAGLPFTPTLSFDPSNTATTARPNRIAEGSLPYDQRTISRWFDTNAFVAPASFTFGNSGRNCLRGPRQLNFDAGLSRAFRLTERASLSFRAEAFNLFNTPQFGLPNSTIGVANAGVIESVINPERQLQFALRLSF